MPASPIEITPHPGPLDAVVRPPGSKSLTNRALVCAALVPDGSVSRLVDPLEADDSMVMREGLRSLGVLIDDIDDPWLVLGANGHLHPGAIDVGASGTTARFLTAVASLVDGTATLDGTPRMRQRPIADLVAALETLGATITSEGGFPPLRITGPIHGGRTTVSGRVSSQFLSALLLVGPVLDGGLQVDVVDGLVSEPYVAGTLAVMAAFGADVSSEGATFRVAGSGYRRAHYDIEADASASVYPAVAVAIAGGRVVIPGIPADSTQPDLAILDILAHMGCRVSRTDRAIEVSADGAPLTPVDADLSHAPDGALAVAVACLFASGPSRLSGLGTLRVKETDRLSALQTEIRRLGARADIEGDDLVITPGTLLPAVIETYDDHRMAMAFSLVGLAVPGVAIADPDCVTKTWPGYFDALEAMCRV